MLLEFFRYQLDKMAAFCHKSYLSITFRFTCQQFQPALNEITFYFVANLLHNETLCVWLHCMNGYNRLSMQFRHVIAIDMLFLLSFTCCCIVNGTLHFIIIDFGLSIDVRHVLSICSLDFFVEFITELYLALFCCYWIVIDILYFITIDVRYRNIDNNMYIYSFDSCLCLKVIDMLSLCYRYAYMQLYFFVSTSICYRYIIDACFCDTSQTFPSCSLLIWLPSVITNCCYRLPDFILFLFLLQNYGACQRMK